LVYAVANMIASGVDKRRPGELPFLYGRFFSLAAMCMMSGLGDVSITAPCTPAVP
jgi:hypothetical protein